jgi:hypothetical protein
LTRIATQIYNITDQNIPKTRFTTREKIKLKIPILNKLSKRMRPRSIMGPRDSRLALKRLYVGLERTVKSTAEPSKGGIGIRLKVNNMAFIIIRRSIN